MEKFVIVSAGRSGSNFLGHIIGSHPNVTYWHELFNRNNAEVVALLTRHKMLLHDKGDPIKYLGTLYDSPYNTPEIKAVGFKLLYPHARTTSWKCVWDYIRQDTHVIHLKRRNILDSYLSYRLADRENSYVSWKQDVGYNETPLRIEMVDVKQAIKSLKRKVREMDFFLKYSNHIEVFYEDICRFPVIMGEIQKFIGVEPISLEPQTYRQRKKPKSVMISNYEELKSQFRDSQFWEYFDEE